jgi:murein DD-endopeptidase MepM/ murein hydrolase activator NlpD
MAAGTTTPTEAGQGPSVLNIAASIGAKIRDAAEDAKEQREKAAEKGETPKKGSLFKSALSNQFNPIKSKKAKSNWAKQFDWNKETKSDQQVKPPTGEGGGDSKGKLKEFIAGGFTAILKDTGMMVSKLDGVKMMTGENLAEATRASSTLTVIKDSIDTQTELRRKALEEAKFARAEKKLEKTSDVAGVSGPKEVEKKDGEGGSDGGGKGPFDWLLDALGIADIVSSIPGVGKIGGFLNKLNPFKKSPVTQGAGGKPPGLRMPGSGPRVTTSGGVPAPKLTTGFKMPDIKSLKSLKPGRGGLLGLGMMGAQMFMPQLQDAFQGGYGSLGFGVQKLSDEDLRKKYKETQSKYDRMAAENQMIPGGQYLTPSREEFDFGSFGVYEREAERRGIQLSEGGMVPSAVPLASGGIVDNPTKTTLNPGDSVIPLNRNVGKQMLGDTNQATPGETAVDTVGAMILGVSAGMLGKTDTGTVGDQVKQNIRKASKKFGISNLTFTSSIGRGQFGKVDTGKDAKDFMMSLFKGMKILGGGGKGSGGGGGKDDNPPSPTFGPSMTATGGSTASQYITSGFGARNTGIAGASTNHKGVDISGGPWQQGTPISVIKPGVVEETGDLGSKGWGRYVVIKHDDGSYSLYGHLSEINVQKGDKIENKSGAAKVIGKVGSTGVSSGPHLHFEVGTGWNGVIQNPVDPSGIVDDYIRGGGQVNVQATSDVAQVKPAMDKDTSLPMANVTQLAQDGMVGPSWLPWNWGKVVDTHRNTKSTDYSNQNSILAASAKRREMMKELGYASGGSKSQAEMRRKMRAGEKSRRATQQRNMLGVVKGGGKSGYTVTREGMRPGESPEQWSERQSQAIRLSDKLNRDAKLGKYAPKPTPPRPAPGRAPTSAGGTRPAPRPAASSTAASSAVAVMPPASASKAPSASATGSFGSAVPAGKTSAMVFADFLYPDLV